MEKDENKKEKEILKQYGNIAREILKVSREKEENKQKRRSEEKDGDER